MDPKQRVELIRQGNQAFNKGDYNAAQKLFIQANYQDGLIRIGDYWYYDKKKPLVALGYYKRAGEKNKIKEIMLRMVYALKQWVRPASGGAIDDTKAGDGNSVVDNTKAVNVTRVVDDTGAVSPEKFLENSQQGKKAKSGVGRRAVRPKNEPIQIPQVEKEKDPLYQTALKILQKEKQ